MGNTSTVLIQSVKHPHNTVLWVLSECVNVKDPRLDSTIYSVGYKLLFPFKDFQSKLKEHQDEFNRRANGN